MTVDNSKLVYASWWDIDQIIDYKDSSSDASLNTSVVAGDNKTIIIPHDYAERRFVIAQYKPDTQTAWFEAGDNGQSSVIQLVSMNVWVTDNDIKFYLINNHGSDVGVEIRYWVMSDGD